MNKRLIAARIVEVLIQEGVKIDSPYDVTNYMEDNMGHSEVLCPLFYGEDGEKLDVIKEIFKLKDDVLIKKMAEHNKKYEALMRAHPSYKEGFETGLNWKENYRPGGPFRMGRLSHETDPAKIKKAEESEESYNAWHFGFNEGQAKAKQ